MYLQGKESEVSQMSMDKAIASGKEHRKAYRGAKAIDTTCRNHGSCKWCKSNRLHKFLKKDSTNDWYDDIINSEKENRTNE